MIMMDLRIIMWVLDRCKCRGKLEEWCDKWRKNGRIAD
jgi:hypothetical protein